MTLPMYHSVESQYLKSVYKSSTDYETFLRINGTIEVHAIDSRNIISLQQDRGTAPGVPILETLVEVLLLLSTSRL